MYDFSPLMLLFIATEGTIGVQGNFKHFDLIWSLPVNCTCLNAEGTVNWFLSWHWTPREALDVGQRPGSLFFHWFFFFIIFPEPQFPPYKWKVWVIPLPTPHQGHATLQPCHPLNWSYLLIWSAWLPWSNSCPPCFFKAGCAQRICVW